MSIARLGPNPPALQGGSTKASTIAHQFMVSGVSVAIPAIAVNGGATVKVTCAGLSVGDVIPFPSLASGSVAIPAGVVPVNAFCATAGQLSLTFSGVGSLATTATTITVNLVVFSAS